MQGKFAISLIFLQCVKNVGPAVHMKFKDF